MEKENKMKLREIYKTFVNALSNMDIFRIAGMGVFGISIIFLAVGIMGVTVIGRFFHEEEDDDIGNRFGDIYK